MDTKEQAYENFKTEAHEQFVTIFLDESPKMKEKITEALTVVLNLEKEPVKKGLMLFSKGYGQGKTFFFEVVYSRVLRKYGRNIFKNTTAKELRGIYSKDGLDALNTFINCKNLFIDDLGDEEENTKNYGDEMNVLRYVILMRYEMWLGKNSLTHLTTNLSIEEIAVRYSSRVSDRLMQMTERIEFDFIEGSFRQIKSTRRLAGFEKKKAEEAEIKTFDEKLYYDFLNKEAEAFRLGKMAETHWIDFWVMYTFLERKGLAMRNINQEDRQKAKAIAIADNKKEIRKNMFSEFKRNVKPLEIENIALSIIAKEYFIKLANRKFVFSEANFISGV